jgi:hypothetical protein
MTGTLLAIGYAALFLYVIQRWRWFAVPGLDGRLLSGVFLLKILAGTCLWAVYTYYYPDRSTADIFKYFDDGNVMYSALPEHPDHYLRMLTGATDDRADIDSTYYRTMNNWYRKYEGQVYNDAHTMIRFNAVVRPFSAGHYLVHTVFACFLGMIGLVGLYRAFLPYMQGLQRWLFAAVFLVPSVVFWASGVLKESLLMFGLGLFTYALLRVAERRWKRSIWPLLAGCLLLLSVLKVYVLLSLLPAAIALCWCGAAGTRHIGLRYAAVYAVCGIVALNASWFVPNVDILDVMRVKQLDFIGVATSTHSGSRIPMPLLGHDIGSFLRQAPHALYVSYISPFLGVRNGPLGAMGAVENLLLPFALLFTWRHRKAWRSVNRPLLYFCIGYVLVLSLIMGWTTPVIGALVRYRVPLLPFCFIALLLLTDPARNLARTSSPLS